MTFSLGKFLILACSLATASAFFGPNYDLYRDSSNAINVNCNLFAYIVKLFPLNYPREEQVSFQLRTPCKNTDFAISEAKKLVTAPGFDVNKKTVVYVNGWLSNMNDRYTARLAKAYFCRNTENFIVVNPSNFLQTEYINSAYNTQELGRIIARGLINLGIPGKNFHLIGHSLGAHIMGMAARTFAAKTNDKIGRITGFDPARPCFINSPVFSRISNADATFVDVIHSNPTQSGTEEAVVHADFYPGGLKPTQVGCMSFDMACSHAISSDYFAETVYPGSEQNFIATTCDSYSQLKDGVCAGAKATMGYAADPTAIGIYFLAVNATSPYGNNVQNTNNVDLKQCGICTA